MKVNENEQKCLDYFYDMYVNLEEGQCTPFKSIADDKKLEIRQVRRACRSLKKKGLAEFHRGLFDDDGMIAGSGYCISKKGAELMEEQEETHAGTSGVPLQSSPLEKHTTL